MPCLDPRDLEYKAQRHKDADDAPILREENVRLSNRCRRLTRLLCEAGNTIEGIQLTKAMSKDFIKWWNDHKKVDARRKKRK